MDSLRIERTTQSHPDFVQLVRALDAELAERDGTDHDYYAQFNGAEALDHVVLVLQDGEALGCGAFKPFGEDAVEIKRMFVPKVHRGKGLARRVLQELEAWAAELGHTRCVLETGSRQHEAIRLYEHFGYRRIDNYGPYIGVENSRCFEKWLQP
jgi:GNAT superfamily N-acetyltransferase